MVQDFLVTSEVSGLPLKPTTSRGDGHTKVTFGESYNFIGKMGGWELGVEECSNNFMWIFFCVFTAVNEFPSMVGNRTVPNIRLLTLYSYNRMLAFDHSSVLLSS